jgi:hypothetical protein
MEYFNGNSENFIDGKWVPDNKLTPDQREKLAKENWAFRAGYDLEDMGIELSEKSRKVIENDPSLKEAFTEGKIAGLVDKQFIYVSNN